MLRFVSGCCFLILCTFSYGQRTIDIRQKTDEIIAVGPAGAYFIDSTARLSIEQIYERYAARTFVPIKSVSPNFGNTNAAVWIAFTFWNTSENPCFLEVRNTQLQHVELYFADVQATGNPDFKQKPEPINLRGWVFEMPRSHEAVTYYLRVQSKRVLTVPVYITSYQALLNRNHQIDFFYGVYFGLMLVIILYNLFLYLVFRSQSYLWYVTHIFLQMLIHALLQGYTSEVLTGKGTSITTYLPSIAMLSYLSMVGFTSSFLDTRRQMPRLHRLLYMLAVLLISGIIINLFPLTHSDSFVGIIAGLIAAPCLLLISVVAYYRQIKGALFYSLGWGIFMISVTILNASLLNWIPGSFFTDNVTLLGGALESLLISLALSNKINQLRKEKEQDQAEKLDYITEQNAWLEQKVTERTRKLADANAISEAQNAELQQQKERLTLANETLQHQNKMIETQREILTKMNHTLEKTVQERTFELKGTVDNLLQQNQDLQQFSYILSHNLRSPIVRIKGLVDVFNRENMNDPLNLTLLGYLHESAENLDAIIRDLSQIISIRKNLNTIKEKIDLSDLFEQVINSLINEIEDAHAQIFVDFSRQYKTFSVKSYLHSIVYNLISNAIKYRSPERALVICITTDTIDSYTCLTIQDNGLGIDTRTTSIQQIFGFYKRLHSHVDGKGLGLYLVKTQVASLQGKIEVESELDQGTTFKVYF